MRPFPRKLPDNEVPDSFPRSATGARLKANFQPTRTVYLVFGQDEEVMGPEGVAKVPAVLQKRGVTEAAFLRPAGD